MLHRECVHVYSKNGLHFAVDGNSGAVHLISPTAAFAVRQVAAGCEPDYSSIAAGSEGCPSPEMLPEAVEEITELIGKNLLFSQDTTAVPPRPEPVVKALCLNVAHDCNLRCSYCFAGTGEFGGKRELMSAETAKRSIDFLLEASGQRQQCEVDFFGGEPLLNWEVVRTAVEYGSMRAAQQGKTLRFTLTTNGILLNEEISSFLNENMYNVVLSLDGRREINDSARQTLNGAGSCYDIVVPRYQRFVAQRGTKPYFVRGTFTRHNLDFSRDVLHMADLGFDQLSMEPVIGAADTSYALIHRHLERVLQEYDQLTDALKARREQGRGFNFFHFQLELKKGPCLYKRIAGCGAGGEYLAVAPDGRLYPCHQFVGQEDFVAGCVESGVEAWDLVHRFQDSHVLNKPACSACWAKFYCSGGCHANNLQFNGSLLEPHDLSCAMERKRLECSFYLHAVKGQTS